MWLSTSFRTRGIQVSARIISSKQEEKGLWLDDLQAITYEAIVKENYDCIT
jgi:hypothetical protein